MGLGAGVMITLSFLEPVARAREAAGYLVASAGFAAGAFVLLTIDMRTPHIRFGETERDRCDPALWW